MTNRILKEDQKFLAQTVELAIENVKSGGGPFGALVVKNGKLISTAANQVTKMHDPTAHAEVLAIRKAAINLEDHKLEGCTIYSSTEPCPMCLGAIYWAGIDKLVFASNKADAEKAGFIDAHIYREFGLKIEDRSSITEHLSIPNAGEAVQAWFDSEDKEVY